MNEKLTAYALNELPPDERAAFEAQMKNDPALRQQAEEMKSFCTLLEREVPQNAGDSLRPAQRAQLVQSFQETRRVIRPLWRRPAFLSGIGFAAAACLAVMLTIQQMKQPPAMTGARVSEVSQSRSKGQDEKSKEADGRLTRQFAAESMDATVQRYLNATNARPMPKIQHVTAADAAALGGNSSPGHENNFRARNEPVPVGFELKGATATGTIGGMAAVASDPVGAAKPNVGNSTSAVAAAPNQTAVPAAPPASAPAPAKIGAGSMTLAGVVARSGAPLSRTAGNKGEVSAGAISGRSQAAASGNLLPVESPAVTNPFGDDAGLVAKADSEAQRLKDLPEIKKVAEESRIDLVIQPQSNTATYRPIIENPFTYVAQQPLSTFSLDVDTASYANVRRFLNGGQRPPPDAVRLEELINYFPYDYEGPADGPARSACRSISPKRPGSPLHRLARVAVKAREVKEERPRGQLRVPRRRLRLACDRRNKLPLVKQSLDLLVEQLREDDRVAIVTYAGEQRRRPREHDRPDKKSIRRPFRQLAVRAAPPTARAASGSPTNRRAQNFIKDGVNRVILCTDGDFNVGVSSVQELEKLIAEKAKSGVFLSVLGFGTGNLQGPRPWRRSPTRGNGNYAYIDILGEARKVLVEQMTGTLVTIAKDVKIQVEFNPAEVAAYRLIGYENRMLAREDFNNDKKDAGEIGAGHTVTALYEIVPASLKYPDGKPLVDELKYQGTGNQAAGTKARSSENQEIEFPKHQAPNFKPRDR